MPFCCIKYLCMQFCVLNIEIIFAEVAFKMTKLVEWVTVAVMFFGPWLSVVTGQVIFFQIIFIKRMVSISTVG